MGDMAQHLSFTNRDRRLLALQALQPSVTHRGLQPLHDALKIVEAATLSPWSSAADQTAYRHCQACARTLRHLLRQPPALPLPGREAARALWADFNQTRRK